MPSTKSNTHLSQKSSLLKVVLLGNVGVGKSALMNRFVHNTFESGTFNTIGVEFLNKDIVVNGETYSLQIWDTAGQERFKSLRTPFYRGADLCILTYSVDDSQSFEDLAIWRSEFLHYADISNASLFPFVIIGNKADVSSDKRQVQTTEAENWCKENNYPFVETSAKDSINVEQAFHMAVEKWLAIEEKLGKPYTGETVDLKLLKQRQKCC